MTGNRRENRSRSPSRASNVGRRRENKTDSKSGDMSNSTLMNQMIMSNMYQQGNMLMAGGMYPNMLMANTMMGGGMISSTGIDMMQGTSMEIMPQASMDMSAMASQGVSAASATPAMDINMMSGIMVDPTMMGMYSNLGNDMSVISEKKELFFKHCILSPPESGSQEPPRRPKPPGCRTIFVGGLPDMIRESEVREIFENYGRIHTLRLSTKNFCHIRFDRENSVDAAILLSGYRIKLTAVKDDDAKDDLKKVSGWLHVDYALSRDDQYEYERRQRMALRAQEAQMQQLTAQQEALANRSVSTYRRSPSPLRVQPFSNAAILQLAEKLKNEDHFGNCLPTLISWLERGECSKKTSTQFYTMLQATNSHIRRLFNEKMQYEEELHDCRERVKNHIERVIEQLEQVAKVFASATHQRVWDHFTKPQRKNIETWQKMTQEFNTLKDEFNEKFFGDDNNEYNNGFNVVMDIGNSEEVDNLKRENESLQFQLVAYKNEVDVIKADAAKEMEKFKAQFIARQALQIAFENKSALTSPISKPPPPISKTPPPSPLPEDLNSKVSLKEDVEAGCGEAKLIGVISAFLQVHPHGASLDYVVSYVRAIFPHVTQATVHHVLQKHPDTFGRTTSGVGANIEHRWSFVAYNNQETITVSD